jgi:chromosome partitioning protein
MPVLAVLNQKGGVGKATLATHITMRLSKLKHRVLLIVTGRSANSQKTMIGWVIDGPPRVSAVAKSAIDASDMVLIPVQPSPYDVWAAKDIVDLIIEVLKGDLKAAFTVSRRS